jgi:hypothetical protein
MLYKRGVRMSRIGEMWSAYASLTESANRQAFVRTIRAVIDPGGQTLSAMDRLHLAAQLPTLIVWGEDDTIIPVSHAYAAHEAIPGSRLEIIEDCGHFPHVEVPERFLDVLREFLEATEPSHSGARAPPALPAEPGLRLTCRCRDPPLIPLTIDFPRSAAPTTLWAILSNGVGNGSVWVTDRPGRPSLVGGPRGVSTELGCPCRQSPA